jgi:polyisoprenoid-binding protein YceI
MSMMRLSGKFAALCPAAVILFASAAPAAEWKIDSAHSAAHFSVRHMMVSTVRGDFGKISGTVNYDPEAPEKAEVFVEIDAASIDTRNEKRDAHLRSEDFFFVEKYPAMTFRSRRVERSGAGLRLVGDLTIRGVTREVVFDVDGPAPPVKDARGNLRTGATATTRIDRTDFGLKWNRALEAGGWTVGHEVTITVDVELISSGS